jgi:hypothetical protein
MSSGSDHDDFIDYLYDKSHREDETLFMPVPDGRPDHWTAFYTGILIGIVGGGILPLAPWLGGSLIFSGYGVTFLTLKRPRSRFARALRFGFAISALLGGLLLAVEVLFPKASWRLIEMASEQHVIFLSVAFVPWAAAIARYFHALFAPAKRPVLRKAV